jgi:hypothetical protein
MEADADFARRLLAAMRAVVRDAGHPSAYPHTKAGQLAALRQKLSMMEEEHWFFSDVQRALVRQEMAARRREP